MKSVFKKMFLSMICFIIFINITLSFADDVEYNDLDDDNIIETSSIGTHELNINARSYIVLEFFWTF